MEELIEKKLAAIQADTAKGSAQLAADGVELLREAYSVYYSQNSNSSLLKTTQAAARLAALRPAMAQIANNTALFLRELRAAAPGAAETAGDIAAEKVCTLNDESVRKIVSSGAEILAGYRSVVTISYSSTVIRILSELSRTGMDVFVLESRPLLEGRKTALELMAAGVTVTLVTDAAGANLVKDCGAVIIGADSVLGDLAVLNKTGSLSLALAAKEFGKPFIAAASTMKINPYAEAAECDTEPHNAVEVWGEHPEICRNEYFEAAPARLVTSYLTEKGALNANAMKAEVDNIRELRRWLSIG